MNLCLFFQDYDQDREDGGGGIDLVKAKKVLKAEDKFDKELKKEQKKTQKRLLKESKHSNDKRNAGAAKLVRFTSYIKRYYSQPSLKLRTANAIFFIYLGGTT